MVYMFYILIYEDTWIYWCVYESMDWYV